MPPLLPGWWYEYSHTGRTIDTQRAYAARVQISAIKFTVAGVLQGLLDRAIQVHGALGMTDDTPLAYWFRHERAARIYDGPDEVHKMVVARRVLGALVKSGKSAVCWKNGR